ncbi:nitroreductase/quinone reductase family protein [Pseudonocardia nigra]|uniref:nitroreductase/quinone reductase family protein n=1 Tax=Pseudonocardia nigra TaxID=1921578 RepID=UPI001C5DF49E|nr:nitroreductase/quinone reductase family protein [Pseudonocardia nigra]
MPSDFHETLVEDFRANGGRVGGPAENDRLLLLTTTGARSGAPHTVPLAYLRDGGERTLVIASAAGASRHPDWFHNLVANPRVTVEDGVFAYEAHAVVLDKADRDRAFARAAEADPGWADHQHRTARTLPVVALEPIPGPPNIPGATSPGAALRLLHDAFRRELALVRKEIAESGPELGAQLRVNCLTLCGGLHHHHAREDDAMFPFLAGSRPELAPVLHRLDREHRAIAALLDDIQSLVSAGPADPLHVLPEFDRLADELERHLAYEEEHVIPALNAPAS